MWFRFAEKYGENTWSNSGNGHDRLIFIPTKDILFAGFTNWAPKDDLKYWIRYKIDIDDKVVLEVPPKE